MLYSYPMDKSPVFALDLREFFEHFQDYLAPKLDTYEQAIYLYVFRHSRLIGKDEVTIGFHSARLRMATGTGEDGKPMSQNTAYKKVASLQVKQALTVLRTTHTGRLMRLHLPSEIEGLISPELPPEIIDIEDVDFFSVPENRQRLLVREQFRCFYTLKALDKDNFIVEHVVSRPDGNNSYRNCVAASREANNRKGAMSAEDFLRRLFREGYLSESEFDDRKIALANLRAGLLKPSMEA